MRLFASKSKPNSPRARLSSVVVLYRNGEAAQGRPRLIGRSEAVPTTARLLLERVVLCPIGVQYRLGRLDEQRLLRRISDPRRHKQYLFGVSSCPRVAHVSPQGAL